jgi:hypothetical protein
VTCAGAGTLRAMTILIALAILAAATAYAEKLEDPTP